MQVKRDASLERDHSSNTDKREEIKTFRCENECSKNMGLKKVERCFNFMGSTGSPKSMLSSESLNELMPVKVMLKPLDYW